MLVQRIGRRYLLLSQRLNERSVRTRIFLIQQGLAVSIIFRELLGHRFPSVHSHSVLLRHGRLGIRIIGCPADIKDLMERKSSRY